MIYPNLIAELARNGLTKRSLATIWGVREATAYDKVNGKTPITINEILLVRDKLCPDKTIDYLISKDGDYFATVKNGNHF